MYARPCTSVIGTPYAHTSVKTLYITALLCTSVAGSKANGSARRVRNKEMIVHRKWHSKPLTKSFNIRINILGKEIIQIKKVFF